MACFVIDEPVPGACLVEDDARCGGVVHQPAVHQV